jgi:DNA-binding NtrC family response regulator
VLEERKFRRVGSNRNIKVDIRLIAATNKNLAAEISKGMFREDLYYRLCVFEIELPPLRERREDIPVLIDHFTQLHANRMGKIVERFSPEAIEILCDYDWPGNVRELANVVERAVIVAKNAIIGVEHLPSDFQSQAEPQIPFGQSFVEAVSNFKKRLLLKSLSESNQNKAEAARQLQISRTYLFRLLNQLGLK